MKKIILICACSFSLICNFVNAQEFEPSFGKAATDFYVNERFTNPGQFGTIPLVGPYNVIANVISTNTFTTGGDFDASQNLWAFSFNSPSYFLNTVDVATGQLTQIAEVTGIVGGQFLNKLSYNPTNGNFYALSHDPNSNSGNQLYTLNITTGVLTPIGTGTGIANGVTMEIDNNGIIYVVNSNSASLYTVDPTTGIGTLVGEMLPFELLPVRGGLTIDPSTNIMYGVFNNRFGVVRSEFYRIDPSTGATTDLGGGSSRQYSLFTIPGDVLNVVQNNLETISVYPNPTSRMIQIDNPTGLDFKSVKLYDLLGRDTGVRLTNDEMNIENLAKGMYILQLETEQGFITKRIVKE